MAAKELSTNINRDFSNTIEQLLPQVINTFLSEFELMTGKKSKIRLLEKDKQALLLRLTKIGSTVEQLELMLNQPISSTTARATLRLLNRFFRLMVPGIPRGQKPVDYVISQMEHLAEPPESFDPPFGLAYVDRHNGLRTYITMIAAKHGFDALDSLLQRFLQEHDIVPVFQSTFTRKIFPIELRNPPVQPSLSSAEKMKIALHCVLENWETLVDVVYELTRLNCNRKSDNAEPASTSLWSKVENIAKERSLATLVNFEWVTIRNSINHGRAYYDPHKGSLEFPDRKRMVSWKIEQAYCGAVDIFMSCMAMMRVWNFAQATRVPGFKAYIDSLESKVQES
ncbi:MAG: hypothetical protein TUN42_09230 [Dehalogenimonas sp.]